MFEFITNHIYFVLITTTFIGILFTPIPNEVVIASSAILSKMSGESIISCFLIVLFTSILSISYLEYLGGKWIGVPLLNKLAKNNLKKLNRSSDFLDKYGKKSLILCYFIPLVRHLIPLMAGMNKMSSKSYLFYTIIGGFLWTGTYFFPFLFIPQLHIESLGELALILSGVLTSVIFVILLIKKRKQTKELT